MRHLTTEELLLHCDGALSPERVEHVQECPACRDSWAHLQTVLFEAEQALRASVPPESAEHRNASRLRLERALYPQKTTAGFPLRWSVVYAVAAALTLMVLSGYLSTQTPTLEDAPQLAVAPRTEQAAEPVTATSPLSQPAGSLEAPQESSAAAEALAAAPEILLADSALPAPVDGLAPVALDSTIGQPEPVRFELSSTPRQVAAQQLALTQPPAVPGSPSAVPAALFVSDPPLATFRTVVEEVATPARISDPVALARVIEGYWLLTQARVWEEDLRPVSARSGLRIEGTVEDEAARERVMAAVLRHAPEAPDFQLRLRDDLTAARTVGRGTRVVHAGYSGPAGGAVRRSLLGHFSDAARRSFVSPQPSALEAELVRYVSEIYRSQSELLSHAYALQRFLGRIDPALLASVDPQVSRRFHDLVQFHLRAIDEREEAIYDRLSEALPRKVWGHRRSEEASVEAPSWREESQGLLEDTLDLDSNLTALFGASSLTVDASEPELSCGELLHRIRTRIRRIKNRSQAL